MPGALDEVQLIPLVAIQSDKRQVEGNRNERTGPEQLYAGSVRGPGRRA
jgi:hypothetical protein